MLDEKTIRELRKAYRDQEGDDPAEDEEVIRDQLTAFVTILTELRFISVDFAVWTPFWTRFAKRKRFIGLVPDENGVLQPVEILGPADAVALGRMLHHHPYSGAHEEYRHAE